MSSAIFVTTMGAVAPNLPFEGLYESGGHSCIGEVPGKVWTILVRVWADDAMLDSMAESAEVVYLEDVAEPTDGPELAGAKPVKRVFNAAKLKAYLLAHGHAKDVSDAIPSAAKDAVAATWAAHKVTAQQWREAGGVAETPADEKRLIAFGWRYDGKYWRIVHDGKEFAEPIEVALKLTTEWEKPKPEEPELKFIGDIPGDTGPQGERYLYDDEQGLDRSIKLTMPRKARKR